MYKDIITYDNIGQGSYIGECLIISDLTTIHVGKGWVAQ